MTHQKLEVMTRDLSAVRCLNQTCNDRGRYDSCYLHVYVLESCWRDYFNNLNEEQQELVLHPERFMLD